ncbi:MAG: HypC/HybG/HupF family hydrogenase formation chaperone [Planctomycetota bacterium]
MCLAIPGKIVQLPDGDPLLKMARVDFGGVVRDVSLAYIDRPAVGEYVIVHVGFAISRVNEAEAQKMLDELDALGELLEAQGGDDPPATA